MLKYLGEMRDEGDEMNLYLQLIILYKRRPYIYRRYIKVRLEELNTDMKTIDLEINKIKRLNTIKKLNYIYMLTP